MYTSKEHQSYEMEQQQQQQQVSPQGGEIAEERVEAVTPNDNNDGVRGSLGSLGGPRMAAGDMLYDGHGSLSGRLLTPSLYPFFPTQNILECLFAMQAVLDLRTTQAFVACLRRTSRPCYMLIKECQMDES